MATNNAVNVNLSGTTGTVAFVGSISPTLVTPILGVAGATSLTFNPTTNGMIGTNTNNNASAGIVGEIISASVLTGAPVALTSTTLTNLTSIVLTAGDWDVRANCYFNTVTGPNLSCRCGINTTSATLPDPSSYAEFSAGTGNTQIGVCAPYRRFNVSTNTTVYVVVRAVFTGTCNATGHIDARRVR